MSLEAALELDEFRKKVVQHKLLDVPTGEALTLVFLSLGSKMWRPSHERE